MSIKIFFPTDSLKISGPYRTKNEKFTFYPLKKEVTRINPYTTSMAAASKIARLLIASTNRILYSGSFIAFTTGWTRKSPNGTKGSSQKKPGSNIAKIAMMQNAQAMNAMVKKNAVRSPIITTEFFLSVRSFSRSRISLPLSLIHI